MGRTSIEWTDVTWNPVSGCSKVSQGCKHCYAERVFPRVYSSDRVPVRLERTWPTSGDVQKDAPISYRARAFTDVRCHRDRLEQPLHWRKPRRVFVNSMSDLFHEDVPDLFLDSVFAVMAQSPQHTFQILTKRPARMLGYIDNIPRRAANTPALHTRTVPYEDGRICEFLRAASPDPKIIDRTWPLSNVWLGVSCEDQATANARIPLLLQTPAAVRFVSLEPLLGPIVLDQDWLESEHFTHSKDCYSEFCALAGGIDDCAGEVVQATAIDWIIVGGESGPKARPMHPDWARSLRDQCVAAGVPFLFKQWGEWSPVREPPAADSHRWTITPGEPDGGVWIYRVGKKRAGRTLDGRTWDEFPK